MKKKLLPLMCLAGVFDAKPQQNQTINAKVNLLLDEAGINYALPVPLVVVEKWRPVFAGHVLFTYGSTTNNVGSIVYLLMVDDEPESEIHAFLAVVKRELLNFISENTRYGV